MDENSSASTKPSDFVYTNTIAILVPDVNHIPHAVKSIYRKLALAATEVDQGVPDLVLSLVSTGNIFSFQTTERFCIGLSRLVNNCALWLITNGLKTDPFTHIVSRTLHSTIPQDGSVEETLSIVINSTKIMQNSSMIGRSQPMSAFPYNTLYLLLNKPNATSDQIAEFGTLAAVKLGSPPPALLIGVPDERSMAVSAGHTPSNNVTAAPTLLLSSTISSYDKHPLTACIFCGATLASLVELQQYISFGIVNIILQDVSELCTLLKTATTFIQKPSFDYEKFMTWLDGELRSVALATNGSYIEQEIEVAINSMVQILSASIGEYPLLHFALLESLNELPEIMLDAFVQNVLDTSDIRRVLKLAVKLNVPNVIRGFKLESVLDEESIMEYLAETLSTKTRIEALSALLDQNIPINISPTLITKISNRTRDDQFFNTVILDHCLGYTHQLDVWDEQFVTDIDDLLVTRTENIPAGTISLSGGFSNLFKWPEWTASSIPPPTKKNTDKDPKDPIQVLALWSLLMNETEIVKCLWAYTNEPLSLALVLAKVARTLAYEAQEWFYRERLLELSNFMKRVSVTLLDRLYEECPLKAYSELCYPLDAFNRLTISQLAFETNNRPFIAHECCQKWLHFLLYKDLQFRSSTRIPNWVQIVLASFLVIPIKWWFSTRQSKFAYFKYKLKHAQSSTRALLGNENSHKNFRPNSFYSVHSLKSNAAYIRDDMVSTEERLLLAPTTTAGSATPSAQSSQQFVMIDDVDGTPLTNFPQNSQIRRTTISSTNQQKTHPTGRTCQKKSAIEFSKFYATPIVKYWISLVFRLLYIIIFSYAVALPGCGNIIFDLFIWIWSLMWWLESIWVLKSRTIYTSWKQMRWSTLDVVVVAVFLLILLVFKVADLFTIKYLIPASVYPIKVLWVIFLLYQCYATLFVYVPLSPVLGPLMVRVRLMVLRDFVNFLILVFLAVCSGAIAIKSILYPDLDANPTVIADSLSWAWLSLFSIDLSMLKGSNECAASNLIQKPTYCSKTNGYENAQCPAQGWVAYFIVMEYLIVIKLICWPLLFALFARTAKNVDQEADRIWKYQLYALGTDFR